MKYTTILLLTLVCIACGTDFLYDTGAPAGSAKNPGPDGITATDGDLMAMVRITWNPVSNAAFYNVYRSTLAEGGAFVLIGSNISGTTSYNDTNTSAFFPYYYKVSWFDSKTNESAFSTADSGYSEAWRAPAPDSVTAIAGGSSDSAIISWTDGGNTSAVSYTVYQSLSSNGPFLAVSNTASLSAEISGLPTGETAWFRVVAEDVAGNASLVSDPVSFVIPPDPGVTAPAFLSATTGSSTTEVGLSWGISADATYYRVYRSTSSNGAFNLLQDNEAGTSWSDTAATAGTTYYYRITAVNGSGTESLPSPSAGGWKGLPAWTTTTLPTASDGSTPNGVHISWLPVNGAGGYAVYRATASGGTYTLQADNITANSWLDGTNSASPTAAGTTYYYKIVCIRSNGDRAAQGPYDAGFRAYSDGPPMPTGVTAHLGVAFYGKVTWDNMNVSSYRVWQSEDYDGPWTQVYNDSDTTYQYGGIFNYGYGYYYRVACQDANGKIGPWSDPVEPAASTTVAGPQGLTASQGTVQGSVQLSWEAPYGATGIKLYRSTSPTGSFSEIADLDNEVTAYTDNITEGKYYYKIRAYNLLYNAAYGQVVMGYPAPYPVLYPPNNLKAVNQNAGAEVVLTWDSVDNAAGYIVFRAPTDTGMYAQISGTVTGTGYTNIGITAGDTWFYKVLTVNQAGKQGVLSDAVNNKSRLEAPAAALASDGTLVNTVAVLWTPVSGASYYRIYRARTEDGIYMNISDPIAAGTTMYLDTAPLPGTAYYKVAAFDGAGVCGDFSPGDAGSSKSVPVPNPPASVSASDGSTTNGVIVTWDTAQDCAYYKVARSDSENGDYVFISPAVSNTTWTDTTAKGMQYFYKIAAFNDQDLSGVLSTGDGGYKKLTDKEFLFAADTTIARSHEKLTLMHNSGTSAVGKETKNGDISGQVAYDAHVSGVSGEIFFDYAQYSDYYMVLNGRYTINANMSENGNMTGTIYVTSPAYNGYIRFDLTITSGNASGGYWYVSQDGAPETQIPWETSPSSK